VLALALVWAGLGAVGTPAIHADATDDQAARAMEEGSDAMARGDFDQAVVAFRRAQELKPTATGPLLALGLALRASNNCGAAVPYLEAYLRRKPDGNPRASKALDQCREFLARSAAGGPTAAAPLGPLSGGLAESRALRTELLGDGRGRSQTPSASSGPADAPAPRPLYKRWWFWTVTGAVVVGGVLAAVLATRSSGQGPTNVDNNLPSGSLGPGRVAFQSP
jgi:hypothetical protein